MIWWGKVKQVNDMARITRKVQYGVPRIRHILRFGSFGSIKTGWEDGDISGNKKAPAKELRMRDGKSWFGLWGLGVEREARNLRRNLTPNLKWDDFPIYKVIIFIILRKCHLWKRG